MFFTFALTLDLFPSEQDMVPDTTSFSSGAICPGGADLPAGAVRRSFHELRPFCGHQAFCGRQSFRGHRSFGEHLHHDGLLVAYETLCPPNDDWNALYTRRDCSSSGYDPNPSSGYGSHHNVSDDILAANPEYNQAV